MKKLTIITVTYNASKVIRNTLRSFVNQTYRDFDVLIIDGASKDDTVQCVADELCTSGIEYRVISERDRGIYDAMNKGLVLAEGEYVLFMNAGDELHAEDTLKKIFTQPVADIYYGKNLLMKNSLPYHETVIPSNLTWEMMSHGMLISHQSILVKKELSVPYDERFKIVADYLWVIDALKKSNSVICCDFPISKYLLDGFSEVNFYRAWKERFVILNMRYGVRGVLRGCAIFLYYLLRWKMLGKYIGPKRGGK